MPHIQHEKKNWIYFKIVRLLGNQVCRDIGKRAVPSVRACLYLHVTIGTSESKRHLQKVHFRMRMTALKL